MEQGRQEARLEGLASERRLLTQQAQLLFGPLPEWVLRKLEGAAQAELESWGERLVLVDTLKAAFEE